MAIAADVQRGMADSSWIRRMFELGIALRQERGAENVFDLSLGNPIAEPPVEFFEALREVQPRRPPARTATCRMRDIRTRGRRSRTRCPTRPAWPTAPGTS